MPLKRCQKSGKRGWKWGSSGKCFIGPGAKEKATKQGKAIGSRRSGRKRKSGRYD